VLLFPPSESCKIRVNFESLYGIKWFLFYVLVKALITLPSERSPRLILIPSLNVDPVAPVFFSLSDPARSTK
jgi:hypothetical protein